MTLTTSKKLERLYLFFESQGTERLNGLDASYFADLDDSEKKEAWNFLAKDFSSSLDAIKGLFLLDSAKAIVLFKQEIETPLATSPYPATRQAIEENRLSLISYVNSVEPARQYIDAMSEFAHSEFPRVRAQCAQCLPIHQVTAKSVEAIKGIVFTETKTLPLASAVAKLMAMHGMDYDIKDPVYKSIYLALVSDKREDKVSGLQRLAAMHTPDYL